MSIFSELSWPGAFYIRAVSYFTSAWKSTCLVPFLTQISVFYWPWNVFTSQIGVSSIVCMVITLLFKRLLPGICRVLMPGFYPRIVTSFSHHIISCHTFFGG